MASFPPKLSKPHPINFALLFLFVSSVSSHQFEVGGDKGWIKPAASANYTITEPPYNVWAGKHRFRIGDTLRKFHVSNGLCAGSGLSAISKLRYDESDSKYNDGNTVFEFNRSGFFYFISGQPEHCRAGQKLIVRVLHHSEHQPPESAPSPGGNNLGLDSHSVANSTNKLAVASSLMVTIVGVLVIVCLCRN